MTLDELFSQMPTAFNPSAADGMNATVQFNISKPRYLVIKDSTLSINEGTAPNPDMTMNIDDDSLLEMMTGKAEGMTLFMTGKLSIDGDMMLGQRLGGLFDPSKLAS